MIQRVIILVLIGCISLLHQRDIVYSSNYKPPFNKNNQHHIYDAPTSKLSLFFQEPNKIYHIRYHHQSKDTIIIPESSILMFEGGHISAPLVFNRTKLSGKIKLQGSSITGSVTNEIFDASWLCLIDGQTDDADNINQIIGVANNIFFPKGDYLLQSFANPSTDIPKVLHERIKCHIGIHKSNLRLFGENDTRFISTTPNVMICVYSCPYQIDNSISNIIFDNITFVEMNDRINFHEFAHTMKIIGVNGLDIINCKFDNFWGDAIMLGSYVDDLTTGERVRNQNVNIVNNYITGEGFNNRNAISVINGKNINIVKNIIDQVSNEKMPGAIDIEANNSAYTIDSITVSHNRINRSNGFGGAICIVSQREAPAHNITVDHNVITNCSNGIAFYVKSNDCVSYISIISNSIDPTTPPYIFVGNAESSNWTVMNNQTSFENKNFGGNINIHNLFIK